ncbi:hypothetical protein C8C83_5515 [Flavobacterium sp. 90]|uniref:hypothetical protein n=1 Tax=unclassified Flavobacterium TaxID=196869 RepID=UPI000EB05094|nr:MULTISPECIES: hypothetical protein [unclassified Flavobacterium]RKR08277.1 hypothetical protein C8C82_0144 [Flavobacterium sp. 81]TCK57466.1 hypothetical protein C8C83_5515 [Flavobacterium sp. 90]
MKQLEFSHIFVIESLRPEDELTGTRLFNRAIYPGMVDKNLESNCDHINVISKQDFFNALLNIKHKIISENISPIIHLEMHGSKNGLQLTSHERITWEELQPILIDLNILCKNNLFLTMATCFGGYIYNAISPRLQSPFWGFVGPFEEVDEDEVLADFTNFYFELLNSLDLNAAEIALHRQNAPNASKFKFQNIEFVFKKVYENYELKHLTPERIKERLQQIEEEFRKAGEYPDWTSERIHTVARNIIVDQNDKIKENLMTKFFMRDIYPELRN